MGLKEKVIDMGHARAILGSPSAEQQLAIYKRIVEEGLSVRKVEGLVNRVKSSKRRKLIVPQTTNEIKQKELSERLGTKVKITSKQISIAYSDEKQLSEILRHII